MNCREALDRMLVADPAVLRGGDDDPALAGHLRTCDRCRRVAATLTAELDALDAGLAELGAGVAPRPASGERRPRGADWRRWRARAWVPLSAAAALAAVLVLGRDGTRTGQPGPRAEVEATLAGGVDRVAVAAPADRGLAVLNTSNPRITVVWFYERSE